MKRRDFIRLLGCTAAWPVAARAQHPSMPVIGYLNGASAQQFTHLLAAFRKGLSEMGYAEGRNVAITYRYADGQYERLPAMAAELVHEQVALIVASAGTPTIRAARTATATIPIVFVIGGDPVKFEIVANLNRPGGNITGVTLVGPEIVAKRLGLLLELAPADAIIGVLANPANPISESQISELQTAARSLSRQIRVLTASSESDLTRAFQAIGQQHVGALIVAADPFFDDRRSEIVTLAAGQRVPASYVRREFVAAGGLMSYGADVPDAYRQAGVYAGRILQGVKPADLPVLQPIKFELVLNLKTAKALGLTVPDRLLSLADEVID